MVPYTFFRKVLVFIVISHCFGLLIAKGASEIMFKGNQGFSFKYPSNWRLSTQGHGKEIALAMGLDCSEFGATNLDAIAATVFGGNSDGLQSHHLNLKKSGIVQQNAHAPVKKQSEHDK
jgi:hypothetical protein